jgi:hypothetical protein
MKIGFTGTRNDMTPEQKATFLREILKLTPIAEFHHGDCVGADATAHDIIVANTLNVRIIIHPPSDDTHRAWCEGNLILVAKSFLARNYDIVAACDLLIVVPRSNEETIRSGTWATYRQAIRAAKPTLVIKPNGEIDK